MRTSIRVECEGYAHISDFETEVLEEEPERRRKNGAEKKRLGKEPEVDAEIFEAYDALCRGRSDDARLILERFLWPKWQSVTACLHAFALRDKPASDKAA